MPLATMPKTLHLQRFRFFVQHTPQGCGARHVFTSIHAFGDHVQNTAFTAFLLLCTTYCASSALLCEKCVKRPQQKKHPKIFKITL